MAETAARSAETRCRCCLPARRIRLLPEAKGLTARSSREGVDNYLIRWRFLMMTGWICDVETIFLPAFPVLQGS
jgi:hypothetical protein